MDRATTQFDVDKITNDKASDLMVECIQNFETACYNNPRVNLDFNWYVESLPLHEFSKVLLATFEITGGVLSKEEKKECNRERFTMLHIVTLIWAIWLNLFSYPFHQLL